MSTNNHGCQTLDFDAIFADQNLIPDAIAVGIRAALLDHKRTGDPIVVADENGQPVWIPADQIVVDEIKGASPSAS